MEDRLFCAKCNYLAKRKHDFKKHLLTKKHKDCERNNEIIQCGCGRRYKHYSSYHRHQIICKSGGEILDPNMVLDLIRENKTLQEQMLKMQKEHNTALQQIMPNVNNVTNNINNNIINVQMYLDEKCANAMSIQNFTKTLHITMEDLEKNKKDCITNVLLRNLIPIPITERPVHCANLKLKKWYIKDENDGWGEDNGEKIIKSTEFGIQKKWLTEFDKEYPGWMNNERLKDKYIRIAGSTSTDLTEYGKVRILNKLGKNVKLDLTEIN